MLASLLVSQSEYEGVVLFLAGVFDVLDHDKGQLLFLEVEFGDFRPGNDDKLSPVLGQVITNGGKYSIGVAFHQQMQIST